MLRTCGETLGGLWQLLRLMIATRFRSRGRYWTWREETAFGADEARRPSKALQREAILDYARWVHRMKRASRIG
jgi:hypothetical protein